MYNESFYNTRNECGVTDDMDEFWRAIERYALPMFDAIVYDEGNDCGGVDLWGANLERANLTDANLTDANLTDVDLTDANLTDVDLTGAIL